MFAVNNEHPEIVQLRVPAATAAALPLPAAEASVVRLENKANITLKATSGWAEGMTALGIAKKFASSDKSGTIVPMLEVSSP